MNAFAVCYSSSEKPFAIVRIFIKPVGSRIQYEMRPEPIFHLLRSRQDWLVFSMPEIAERLSVVPLISPKKGAAEAEIGTPAQN